MEPPPSDRRQPPDGHEFPDFEESFQNRTNDSLLERFKSRNTQSYENEPVKETSFRPSATETFSLNKTTSKSNMDLSTRDKDQDKNVPQKNESITGNISSFSLYSRSQSLCDISTRNMQNDPLQNLVEQRRKNLSKLKGLVIPDSISEGDLSPTINLPEIKSSAVSIEEFQKLNTDEVFKEPSQISSVNETLPPISPAWAASLNFPKYSPAFKRKDLKVYSINKRDFEKDESKNTSSDYLTKKPVEISPARSENSLDISSRDIKYKAKRPIGSFSFENNLITSFRKREINTDEESDNDSAVSSSQSSFVSRPTTSPSSTASFENYDTSLQTVTSEEFRHGKASNVDALNRKNILASAKCRSGKDFKIGSPVVNRKLEITDDKTEIVTEITNMKMEKKEEIKDIEKKVIVKPFPKISDVPKLENVQTGEWISYSVTFYVIYIF